jgi:hypothetical protein
MIKNKLFTISIVLTVISTLFCACVPINLSVIPTKEEKKITDGVEITPLAKIAGKVDGISTEVSNPSLSGLALLIGIYKLESTNQALTKDQANSLLPLWEKLQTLSGGMGSGTGNNPPGQPGQGNNNQPASGQGQIQGTPPGKPQGGASPSNQGSQDDTSQNKSQKSDLIKQIQAVLTADQVKAISDMKISQDNMQTILKDLGISMNAPQGVGNGNGQGQGEQPADNLNTKAQSIGNGQQNTNGSSQNGMDGPMADGDRMPPEVIKVVFELLAKKAGVELPTSEVPSQNNQSSSNNGGMANGGPGNNSSATFNTIAVYKQSGGSVSKSDQTINAVNKDQSGVNVTEAGTLELSTSAITTSGNSSNNDQSSFYGLNAAVLADSASKISLTDTNISTTGSGANGVFATGKGTKITMVNGSIKANGGGGHGVMATQGGEIVMTNVNMDTQGANGAPYATDRGGGTITASGGTVTSSGQDSPGVYSTGTITIKDATITSTGAEAAVIEGANTINLTDTQLTSTKDDKWGVLVYQSMSGDAEGAKGVYTMTGGSLTFNAENGPLFFITNTTGVITLKHVAITNRSNILIKAAAGNWGNKGSNGGTVIFTADTQSLKGNILADSISKVSLTLQNGSNLESAINTDKQAASVNLALDTTSQWTVPADSYLNGLSDEAGISGASITNIIGNGHNVYYDATLASNSLLGGKTYSLVNGGQLIPEK